MGFERLYVGSAAAGDNKGYKNPKKKLVVDMEGRLFDVYMHESGTLTDRGAWEAWIEAQHQIMDGIGSD